jgi:predicted neutral ceramidase superfamily lipid hydrolase
MTGQTIQWQNKKERRTDNTKTKQKWQKERQYNDKIKMTFCHFYFGHCIVCHFCHCIVCPSVIFILVIVLSVLLSYIFWSLCCLSFCPISFVHCVVCPFVLFLLFIVLSVLLSYFFPKEIGQKDRQHNDQKI